MGGRGLQRCAGLLGRTVGDGLASLETALVDWVHGRLDDDIALVLLEYAGEDHVLPQACMRPSCAAAVSEPYPSLSISWEKEMPRRNGRA